MGVTLFLSPHLDDAILSCSALIAKTSRPVIVSFFTEGDDSYAARREEDLKACELAQARAIHLGLPDAPFRGYNTFLDIVSAPMRHQKRTQRALAKLLDRYPYAMVIAPLGLGNHVDHRLVRSAAVKLVPRARLLFYEDRPYAFSLPLASPAYFAAHYVKTYLGDTPPDAVRAAFRHVRPFPATPAVQYPPPDLKPLRAYRSQLPHLFASHKEMGALYKSAPETYYVLKTPASAPTAPRASSRRSGSSSKNSPSKA